MKTFLAAIMCIICCSNNVATNEKSSFINEDKKHDFESFISKFDVYSKPCIDMEFFMQRNE